MNGLIAGEHSLVTRSKARAEFQYLRSVCPTFQGRLFLGRAIHNGWSAEALTQLAESFRGGGWRTISPKEAAYQEAISIGAERFYDASKPRNSYWMLAKAPIALDK